MKLCALSDNIVMVWAEGEEGMNLNMSSFLILS